MHTLPFLYLPDAVTLILLLVVFGELRKVATDHIRLELLMLRKEMLLYWLNNALDFNDRGYVALRNLIGSSMAIVPRFSPGRLMFLYRLRRTIAKDPNPLSFPDPSQEVSILIERTANVKGREKLKRLQLEMNIGLGAFFLMGSLSGWFLFAVMLSKMLKRTISHHQNDRTDIFFDMVERALVHLGRQAQQIGLAGHNLTIKPESPAVQILY